MRGRWVSEVVQDEASEPPIPSPLDQRNAVNQWQMYNKSADLQASEECDGCPHRPSRPLSPSQTMPRNTNTGPNNFILLSFDHRVKLTTTTTGKEVSESLQARGRKAKGGAVDGRKGRGLRRGNQLILL